MGSDRVLPSSVMVEEEEEEAPAPAADGEGPCMDCEWYSLPVLLLEWYMLDAVPTGGYMQPRHSKPAALWAERRQDHRKASLMDPP